MEPRLSKRGFLKLASLLPLSVLAKSAGAPVPRAKNDPDKPNILILVFDTLSARHCSLYGYRRQTTSSLEEFAETATVFHAHHASGNFTSPGTASILTGTYPWSHRAFHLSSTPQKEFTSKNIFSAFREQGYTCLGFSHNLLVNILIHQFRDQIDVIGHSRDVAIADQRLSGLIVPEDFDIAARAERSLLTPQGEPPNSLFLYLPFWRLWTNEKKKVKAEWANLFPRGLPSAQNTTFFLLEDTMEWVVRKLEALPQPFLAYLHFMPPHSPYTPRKEFIGLFDDGWTPNPKPPHHFSRGDREEELVRRRRFYDEYIAYTDAEFGHLIRDLRSKGLLDNTWTVFTSDHGEMFERGIQGHITPTLFEPVIHIPLLIAQPGQQTRQDVYSPTNSVDLLPTLLHAMGQPKPDWCEGEVLPLSNEAGESRSVFSVEAKNNSRIGPLAKATVAMMKGSHKLIYYLGYSDYDGVVESFDLAADPEERNDLSKTGGSIESDLFDELLGKLTEVDEPFRS